MEYFTLNKDNDINEILNDLPLDKKFINDKECFDDIIQEKKN